MIRSDAIVKSEGMKILCNGLGKLDAERFVSLILREQFNYEDWRSNLQNEDIDLRELSRRAMNEYKAIAKSSLNNMPPEE